MARRRSSTPAFVSLLCICIVFVPMFFLPGVARFPVRADGDGGGVRDDRLVHPVAHAGADDGDVPVEAARARPCSDGAPRRDVRWSASSGVSSANSSGCALAMSACSTRALAHRPLVRDRFPGRRAVSFLLLPFLGQQFLSRRSMPGRSRCTSARRSGARIEDTAARFDRIDSAIRQIDPADELTSWSTISACRSARSTSIYNNTRHHRPAGRRYPDRAERRPSSRRANMSRQLRRELPRRFPGTTFSFLPADITSQILNFGAPAPIDVQVTGRNAEADPRLCRHAAAQHIARFPA